MLTPDPRPQTLDWPQAPEYGDIVTVLIHNYYLQTVNTASDCLLSFAEFGLGWLLNLTKVDKGLPKYHTVVQ